MRNAAAAAARSPVPLLITLALFTVLTMALMAWSHQRWDATLRDSVVALDRLAQTRRFTLTAEVYLDRLLAGDTAIGAALVMGSLERALQASRDLLEGQGTLAGMEATRPAGGALHEAVLAHVATLEEVRRLIRARLASPAPAPGSELRASHGAVEHSARRVEAALLDELRQARLQQHRLDALNIVFVALLTLGLIAQRRAADRRTDAAHRALAESAARLSAFASAMPEISFLLDRDGRYLAAFGTADSELLRHTPPESFVGRTVRDLLPPALAEEVMAVIRRTLDAGTATRQEFRLEHEGAEVWQEARVAPVAGAAQVAWLSWDVTERRRTEQRVRDLTRLYSFSSQVGQAIVFATDAATLLQRICDVAVRHGGFRLAWIGERDAADGWLRTRAMSGDKAALPGMTGGFDPRSPDWAGSPPVRAFEEGMAQALALQPGGDPLPPWQAQALAAGLTGLVAVPLRSGEAVCAVLVLLGERIEPRDGEEAELFRELGHAVSHALTHFARETERRQIEERIRLHAAALESTRDGVMVTDLGTRIVSVNPAFTEITGYRAEEVIGRTPQLLHSGRHGQAFYRALWQELLAAGHWQGELWNRRKSGELYTQWMSISAVRGPRGEASHYVAVFTDITQLKQTEERLHRMAHYDPLTELPNRLLVLSRLDHALATAERHAARVAVLFIDLDNFKTINDGLGHAAGDEVLRGVAQRLLERLRRQDTVGRLGGDEFIVVLEQLHEPQEAALLAQQLLQTLAAPFRLAAGQELYVQASIGISLYPDDGRTTAELVRDADAAMYQAKRSGRSTYRFYTEALTVAANARLALETRLRRALELGRFELRYQPLVDLRSGRMLGVEALVRLGSDGLAPIGPAEFIAVLEESGQIVQLGEWVQREACRQGRAWHDAGHDVGLITVNLSAVEIRRGGLEARLRALLAETGFPPERLELEITESSLMEQAERPEQAEAFLKTLTAIGVRLSIDDFGTGYSSLAYLKRFPVSKLKIDRSFIRDIPEDPNDMQLAATIIAMGRNLGLTVLAEGVETPAQLDFLRERGCDAWQGYLCSPPLTAAELERRFFSGGDAPGAPMCRPRS